jgi:hypothetical protein
MSNLKNEFSLVNQIKENSYKNKIVDSFAKYRSKIIWGTGADSTIINSEKGNWLFIPKKSSIKKYYTLILYPENLNKNINAYKIRTLHNNEIESGILKSSEKFPLPDSFMGYRYYKKGASIDSIVIPFLIK